MKQLPHDERITRSNFFKVHLTTLDAKPDRILKSYLCRIILRMPKKYSATVPELLPPRRSLNPQAEHTSSVACGAF
ncbi:MAG: hypothetical protein NT070_14335 [Cyanobacteria bacterium]|nr:hypothetical protein [Cyanobacteriota bacterium]